MVSALIVHLQGGRLDLDPWELLGEIEEDRLELHGLPLEGQHGADDSTKPLVGDLDAIAPLGSVEGEVAPVARQGLVGRGWIRLIRRRQGHDEASEGRAIGAHKERPFDEDRSEALSVTPEAQEEEGQSK